MEKQATQMKRIRHTRIRVSTTEQLLIRRAACQENDLTFACPHCGELLFHLEAKQTGTQVQHEYEHITED